jgi:hypothetical protein
MYMCVKKRITLSKFAYIQQKNVLENAFFFVDKVLENEL